MRNIYLNDEEKEMKQQWKDHKQRMILRVKHITLLTMGFGILPPRDPEEEEHVDEERNAALFEVVEADFTAHLLPNDKE